MDGMRRSVGLAFVGAIIGLMILAPETASAQNFIPIAANATTVDSAGPIAQGPSGGAGVLGWKYYASYTTSWECDLWAHVLFPLIPTVCTPGSGWWHLWYWEFW